MINDLEYWSPLAKSDHCILYFKFECYIPKSASKTIKYNYSNGNYEKFKSNLKSVDWKKELEKYDNIEEKWHFFKSILLTNIDQLVPQSKNHNRPNKPAFNENILAKIRKKHRAWQRYMETQNGEKYQEPHKYYL